MVNAEELQPVVNSLAAKLAALELDDDEARALVGALAPDGGDVEGVEGFAYDLNPNQLKAYDLNPNDLSVLISARIRQSSESPWMQGDWKFRC